MNDIHGILFAYRSDANLGELTRPRNTCSLPFGGRYRLIDFMLSNCVNAGMTDVGVVVHQSYQSLLDHLGSGKDWDLSRKHGGLRILPPFSYTELGQGEYRGSMEALAGVYDYLEDIRQDYVLLAWGDMAINLPVNEVFEQHRNSGADITIVCTPTLKGAPQFSEYVEVSEEGRITDLSVHPTSVDKALESLEVYILSKRLLMDMVNYCSAHDVSNFSRGVLQPRMKSLKMMPYIHKGYAGRFQSVGDYFQRSKELLDPAVRADLFNPARPIRTKDQSNPSTYYGPESRSSCSLVADGCQVEGEVENSILFRGVVVEKGAKVSNSVLMQGTVVKAGASLSYVIADKDVTVNESRMLMGHATYPLAIAKGSVVCNKIPNRKRGLIMKILFATSEAAPFIKTGGLADVAGSLPQALAAEGHEVKVILPLYEGISEDWRSKMTFLKYFNVTLAWRQVYCGVFEAEYQGVTFWFVDNEYYFKRWQLYGHFDDCERYAYFSRAVVETPGQLGWSPDVIHCNDWQTALVPVYLLEEKYRVPELAGARTVFTIHNIEYQGRYGDQVLQDVIGLDRSYFNEGMLAYHRDVNLMKGAIMASNFVTTVSPTYAQELRTPFYAHGLDGVINQQSGKLEGILNGIDTALYDPASMPGLAANYTQKTLLKGKAACKAALQQAVGLQDNPDIPLIACVSRLVGHKGFSLVTDALHDIMDMNVQMVVLGTGDWQYEEAFRHAQNQYPGRFSAQLTYSAPLSNMIYAGADLFLMPSVSEPCGLSQMIAMRFGTIPVVRETGGLRDSVTPYNKYEGTGRGFTFSNISAGDMVWVLREAVDLYHNDKKAWRGLQKEGMSADFSWKNSAQQYLDIYNRILG